MFRRHWDIVFTLIAIGLDAAILLGLYLLAYSIRFSMDAGVLSILRRGYYFPIQVTAVFLLAFLGSGLYRNASKSSLAHQQSIVRKGMVVGLLLLGVVVLVTKQYGLSRTVVGLFLLSSYILLLEQKALLVRWNRWMHTRGYGREGVWIVGEERQADQLRWWLEEHREWGYEIQGWISSDGPVQVPRKAHVPCIGTAEDLSGLMAQGPVDRVILIGNHTDGIREKVWEICKEQNIPLTFMSTELAASLDRLRIHDLLGISLVGRRQYRVDWVNATL